MFIMDLKFEMVHFIEFLPHFFPYPSLCSRFLLHINDAPSNVNEPTGFRYFRSYIRVPFWPYISDFVVFLAFLSFDQLSLIALVK